MQRQAFADTSGWTRENLAWLAGLLEGEGCFLVTNSGRVFNIVMHLTDLGVVQKACAIAGMGAIAGPMPGRAEHYKPIWRWKVSRQQHVYALCAALYPFMGERRSAKIRGLIDAWKENARTKLPARRRRRWMPVRGSWSASAADVLWD